MACIIRHEPSCAKYFPLHKAAVLPSKHFVLGLFIDAQTTFFKAVSGNG
jgi:hypothetical protein